MLRPLSGVAVREGLTCSASHPLSRVLPLMREGPRLDVGLVCSLIVFVFGPP